MRQLIGLGISFGIAAMLYPVTILRKEIEIKQCASRRSLAQALEDLPIGGHTLAHLVRPTTK